MFIPRMPARKKDKRSKGERIGCLVVVDTGRMMSSRKTKASRTGVSGMGKRLLQEIPVIRAISRGVIGLVMPHPFLVSSGTQKRSS